MVNNTKVLRLIGLAMRAGKVKFGSDSCMEAIIQNKIKVLYCSYFWKGEELC